MIIDEVEVGKLTKELCNIHNGYTCIYSCINYNLILSDNAKLLYLTLAQHCYGEKRDCNPSQERLALMLGMSRQRVINSSAELEKCGVIKTKKPNNCNTVYCLPEVHKLPIVIHSDILWLVYFELEEQSIDYEAFHKAIKEYKKSDLFNEVSLSDEPRKYAATIRNFFYYLLGIEDAGEMGDEYEGYFTVCFENDDVFIEECHKCFYLKYGERFCDELITDSETKKYENKLMTYLFRVVPVNPICVEDGEAEDIAKNIKNGIDKYLLKTPKEQCSVKDFAMKCMKQLLGDDFSAYMQTWEPVS